MGMGVVCQKVMCEEFHQKVSREGVRCQKVMGKGGPTKSDRGGGV